MSDNKLFAQHASILQRIYRRHGEASSEYRDWIKTKAVYDLCDEILTLEKIISELMVTKA